MRVDRNTQEEHLGSWRVSIPLPYYLRFGRVRCECGEVFWSSKKYRIHYYREHIKPEEF